jgi:hypothetical protein
MTGANVGLNFTKPMITPSLSAFLSIELMVLAAIALSSGRASASTTTDQPTEASAHGAEGSMAATITSTAGTATSCDLNRDSSEGPPSEVTAKAVVSPTAQAEEDPPVLPKTAKVRGTINAVSTSSATVAAPPFGRLPVFGLGADVGLPDGGNVSLVVRPRAWARFSLAAGNNTISYGWRLGATWLPLRDGPALVVEYGRYKAGDANPLAGKVLGNGFEATPLLERVGYDYVNLHIGLNLGYRRAVFFVQGGLSVIHGKIYNAERLVSQQTAGPGSPELTLHGAPAIRATAIAGKIGLLAFIW